MRQITDYTNLITSEHADKPNFVAWVGALVQPFVDAQNLLLQFSTLFDVALAQGQQLDMLGNWIGLTRTIAIPLQNTVFFSWGTVGLGWGQAVWFGPGNTLTGYVTLDDNKYRALLLAKIASNFWDGTVPGAYAIWNIVFQTLGFQILIQDNQDMSMDIIFLSSSIDALTQSLLVNGYLNVRPAGVRIAGYFTANVPVFGWGPPSGVLAGWGTGNWLQTTQVG